MQAHTGKSSAQGLALVLCLVAAGCSTDQPERTLFGSWVLDPDAMRQAGLPASGNLLQTSYLFQPDGSASEELDGSVLPAHWVIAGRDGETLIIALRSRSGQRNRLLRVTILDADHLKVENTQGGDLCYLRRAS